MTTNTKQAAPQAAVMVRPGERAVLLSHHEYRHARRAGAGLGDYDILMRRPEEDDPPGQSVSEDERWRPVSAEKYLKHRAIGWREAESVEELPADWQAKAEGRDIFPNPPETT